MKGSFKKLVILLMIFAAFSTAFAAGNNGNTQGRALYNVDIVTLSAENSGALTDVSFQESRAAAFSDKLGTHTRTKQEYQGIVVEGGEKIVNQWKDGRVTTVGSVAPFARNAYIPTVATLSEKEAVAQAAAHFGFDKVTSYSSELRIYPVSRNEALLTYRIDMMIGHDRYLVWMDANGTGFVNGWLNSQSIEYPGVGVLGDSKMLNVTQSGSNYLLDTSSSSTPATKQKTWDLNNGTNFASAVVESTTASSFTDGAAVDAHAYAKATLDMYYTKFNRNSYDNAGATVNSYVHYSSNYVNAYWDGAKMVYGDGDGVNAISLSGGLDVVGHEISHAVTERTWGGNYSNESGALNESFSDVFGAYVEKLHQPTKFDWLLGEDIWTPGTAGDALRYMNNPTQDGSSKDHYSSRYTGTQDNGGVHWNSGISNLAFYLLSQGGSHPRLGGVTVPALGIDSAAAIFFHGFTTGLTSTATFAQARTATMNAAQSLYGTAAADATGKAWEAVGVGGGTTPPPATVVTLSNGVASASMSGSAGTQFLYKLVVPTGATNLKFVMAGGTGDSDLYVKFGSQPTSTSYDQKSEGSTNAETINIATAQAGTYYVTVQGYSTFSGAVLTGSYTTGTTGTTYTPINQTVSGAKSSKTYFNVVVPSGATNLKFALSGGTGDADLYVKLGSNPTTTSYGWRSWASGNTENITIASPAAGTYYIMLNGYTAYSGATLKVTYFK